MNWLRGALILATVWSPIWAYFIWRLEINSRNAYLYTAVTLQALTMYLSFSPLRIRGVTLWLHWYSFFLLVYLLVIGYRYKFRMFNRVLAMGIILVFMAGEWWELPIFVADFAGKMGWVYNRWSPTELTTPWIFSHVRRVYTLAAAYLFQVMTGWRGTVYSALLLVGGTVATVAVMWPMLVSRGTEWYWEFGINTARLVCLSLMLYVAISGLEEIP